MPNRRDLPPMSLVSSEKRLERTSAVLGATVTSRVIALALYFLGANLKGLSQFLGMPLDTIKTLVKRTLSDGLPALEDRRRKASVFLPQIEASLPLSCKLLVEQETVIVVLNDVKRIAMPRSNKVQCRVVLLTLLEAKLLNIAEVARTLGLSVERTRKLGKALIADDVNAVLDKRKGQQQDYLFTPEVKSELIQQFVLNALSGWSTSGRAVADDLHKRCDIVVSESAARLQLSKLGLSNIAHSLLELINDQKKTSSNT